jgi:hypothetical protein
MNSELRANFVLNVLRYQLYGPDLAPGNCRLVVPLKKRILGGLFQTDFGDMEATRV